MKLLFLQLLAVPAVLLRRDGTADLLREQGSMNGKVIDVSAWSASLQKSLIIKAKVKFNDMSTNYPNLFHGEGPKGMAFTSHGLGPSYKARKGLACFYLQTSTNLGPHGRGIDYPGGWIPSKVRLDDGEWHDFELVKGVSGTMLKVDGKRMEALIKHHNQPHRRSKFILRPVSKILVGTAKNTGFNGDIKDVQIFTGGKRVYGSAPEGSQNLARGLVPTGSSDSIWGLYPEATDGMMHSYWHAGDRDYPSELTLNLGSPSKIDGMKIPQPEKSHYTFKTLEIFRSNDGKSWEMVRTVKGLKCTTNRVDEFDGWGETTKFVRIRMKDRCGGGHFAFREWEVYGVAAESLAQGIVASGSSDSKWGSFPGATDGKKGTPWHGRPGDMPATLALNLGLPTTVAGMSILTPGNSGNYGFKSLKIFRSMDGTAWQPVRVDTTSDCSKSRETFHAGWPELTQYVKIEMSNICGGTAFAIAEWEIFGSQHKCRGNLLQVQGDQFPCDSVKDEKSCRASYVKAVTGQYFQCGLRKASEEVSNCLMVGPCET